MAMPSKKNSVWYLSGKREAVHTQALQLSVKKSQTVECKGLKLQQRRLIAIFGIFLHVVFYAQLVISKYIHMFVSL